MASPKLVVDVDRLSDICARYGVARLEVFGSFAKAEAHDDSDIDLLYELAPDAHLGWEIDDLAGELEAALGHPVDLVAKRWVHPRLRHRVLSQAKPLYAA